LSAAVSAGKKFADEAYDYSVLNRYLIKQLNFTHSNVYLFVELCDDHI